MIQDRDRDTSNETVVDKALVIIPTLPFYELPHWTSFFTNEMSQKTLGLRSQMKHWPLAYSHSTHMRGRNHLYPMAKLIHIFILGGVPLWSTLTSQIAATTNSKDLCVQTDSFACIHLPVTAARTTFCAVCHVGPKSRLL